MWRKLLGPPWATKIPTLPACLPACLPASLYVCIVPRYLLATQIWPELSMVRAFDGRSRVAAGWVAAAVGGWIVDL